jgi:tetratricopeptide (TPR) repeat protein
MSLASKLKDQGNAAFKAGEFQVAADFFTDAIDISPDDHILHSNRSGAYASLKDYGKAGADALRCTQLAPDWAKGWVRLGVAQLGLKDIDGARKAYEKALSLEPANVAALEGLEKVPSLGKRKRPEDGSRESLIDELYAENVPMKVKNEIVKKLNEFPANKQVDKIDIEALEKDLEVLSKSQPFAFLCIRCDKAKISTLLGTWKKNDFLCHACYDHLVRCVLPVRNLPASQRPEKCIHQVPRGYLKQYRN